MDLLKVIFLVVISCLFSCDKSLEKKEREFLGQAMNCISLDKDYKWIVILPGVGCHGCIQEGELFFKQNIQNEHILFVLTNVASVKILQFKTGVRINEHKNVYIDKSNKFKISTENAIYPCIVQVAEGKYLQHNFQSPKTTAFRNLKRHLQKDK